MDRWFAEPVKAVYLPTRIFLANKSGFPVLSRPHQAVVRRFMQVRPCAALRHTYASPSLTTALKVTSFFQSMQTVQHFVISGRAERHRNVGGLDVYMQYVRHLWETMQSNDESEAATKGYEDYLQAPLQVRRRGRAATDDGALLTAETHTHCDVCLTAPHGQPRVANLRGL